MITPEETENARRAQALKSIAIGNLKLLSSSVHYVWCVRWSVQGNYGGTGSYSEKALAELEKALAHLNEAAHIVKTLGGVE